MGMDPKTVGRLENRGPVLMEVDPVTVGRYENRSPVLMEIDVLDGKAVQHVPLDTVRNMMVAWD